MTDKSCLLCNITYSSAGNTCKECYDALTGKDKPYGNILGNKTTMLHDDIGDLVKFKNNLRWRKWPEEKPDNPEDCLIIDYNGDILLGFYDGSRWCGEDGSCGNIGEYLDTNQVAYWLPISALPKPESKSRTEGEL